MLQAFQLAAVYTMLFAHAFANAACIRACIRECGALTAVPRLRTQPEDNCTDTGQYGPLHPLQGW